MCRGLEQTDRSALENNVNRPQEMGAWVLINVDWYELSAVMMKRATLTGVNMMGCNLSMAQLDGALMRNVKCNDADLRGAQLVGANLTNANLSRARMSRMHIAGGVEAEWPTNLTDADLRSANLSGADLRQANFEGQCCKRPTCARLI